MIVRILDTGQFDVDDGELEQLNELDAAVQNAVDRDDRAAFGPALSSLLAGIRRVGKPVAPDTLIASELVLPADDMDIEQVRGMLGYEGLIPG
jgi:hypothetical protein